MENQFQVDYRSKHKNVDENNRAFEVKKKKNHTKTTHMALA